MIFMRRRYLWYAQLFFIVAMSLVAAAYIYQLWLQASDLLRGPVIPFGWAANLILWFVGVAALLHFGLIFPRRHVLLDRHPALILWVYLGLWVLYAGFMLVRLPAATTAAALIQLSPQATSFATAPYFLLLGAALISNYQHLSNQSERRQLYWILWGLLAVISTWGTVTIAAVFLGIPFQSLFGIAGLCFLALPASFGVAILRENLFDIDLILNRTLVYVPLTAIIAGLFAATITLSQKLFVALTGQSSDAATVLTTLVIVATFDPLKTRLQKLVDLHFKETADPLKELESYRAQTRSVLEVIDPQAIARRTLEVTARAFDAMSGAIFWMNGVGKPIYTVGGWNGESDFSAALKSPGGELLARIMLGPRRDGKKYTDQDRINVERTLDLVARAMYLSQGR